MFLLQDDRVQIEYSSSLIFLFLWDFPNVRVYLIFFLFYGQNVIFYERQLNDCFFVHNNRWTLLRIFLIENQEDKMFDAIFWCWMACMYPYLVWNIGPLSLTLHCHRVSLYIIQSLLCAFDSSAHPCASLQLRCVWSAHPMLSVTITALVVS